MNSFIAFTRGSTAGIALSWYASTAIATLLFQSSARDLALYLYAAIVLGVVALGASVAPAWRATRADPAIALRAEWSQFNVKWV